MTIEPRSILQGAFLAVIAFGLWYLSSKKHPATPSFIKKGSTPTLDTFGTDFTTLAREHRIDPVVGREEEILRLAQVLARRGKNNAILVGPPGVGKTAIVEGLAVRIVNGDVPSTLQNKRVLALDVTSLLSGTKYRGEFEERAKKIVREIQSANRSIILFIDEIHSVIQSSGTEGAVNFADILKPALARGDLQMIGATTHDEYEKYIKTDLSLERRFQPVEVDEPSEEETITILQGIKDKFREYHGVEFTDAAIHTAVHLTKMKIKDRKLPDKAIDAMDEAAAMVKVAHIHEAIPAILYQAAVEKDPSVKELWETIQTLDKKLRNSKKKSEQDILSAKRETTEKEIVSRGIVTVDSDDIERVVNNWYSTT
ncbi:MAG TPA: AAA family ATPase [Candidatus Kapabacteria bacterium]|nr:AAA family ATPase [Candidatus Kapabacteria bacterium]